MANELDLKKIIVPKLNQAGYGANLGQVFDNIDTNFKIIGNKDSNMPSFTVFKSFHEIAYEQKNQKSNYCRCQN